MEFGIYVIYVEKMIQDLMFNMVRLKWSKSMEHSEAWREIQYLEFATYNLLLFTPISISFFCFKIN